MLQYSAPAMRPIAPLSTTLIGHRQAVVIVSAKIRRRREKNHVAEGGEEMGGMGLAVLSAIQSSEPKTPQMGASASPLSGSDVLLALQRAAADKKARVGSRKGKKGKRMGGSSEEEGPAAADYSNVRPLNIRSDWAARLDEMERLLEELNMEEEARLSR